MFINKTKMDKTDNLYFSDFQVNRKRSAIIQFLFIFQICKYQFFHFGFVNKHWENTAFFTSISFFSFFSFLFYFEKQINEWYTDSKGWTLLRIARQLDLV